MAYPADKDKLMNNKIFYFILAALCIIMLAGCLTPKKADKQLAKVMQKFPKKIPQICIDSFPCITIQSDTTLQLGDSMLLFLDCPDNPAPNGTAEDYAIWDTATSKPATRNPQPGTKKTYRVQVKVPVYKWYITRYIEDTRKIKIVQTERDQLQKKLTKKTTWIRIIATIAGVFILLCLGLFFFFVKKPKP